MLSQKMTDALNYQINKVNYGNEYPNKANSRDRSPLAARK